MSSNKVIEIAPPLRACGGCRVCCKVDRMPGIKEGWEDCNHFCDAGCDLYPEQPAVCKRFECCWKTFGLPDRFRPDRCGLVVSHRRDLVGLPSLLVSEGWEGSREGDDATALMKLLCEAGFILCVRIYGGKAVECEMSPAIIASLTGESLDNGSIGDEFGVDAGGDVGPTASGNVCGLQSRGRRTGRNEPCPCGSGHKYKRCCLRRGETNWGMPA